MAALAASVQYSWIPEDDLLLKNAVEAGASLEALARGAVRFFRKFTLRELRERWHSLLYDADVSMQTSAQMVELELVSAKFGNSGDGKVGGGNAKHSVKRKVETVRRLYRAMRKKSRIRNDEGFNIGFLDGLDTDECLRIEGQGEGNCVFGDRDGRTHFDFGELRVDIPEFDHASVEKDGECLVGDNLVNLENCASADTMVVPRERIVSPLQRVPLWKSIEDVFAPEIPMDECVETIDRSVENSMTIDAVNVDKRNSAGENAVCKDTDVDNCFNAISESDFTDLSETLLVFANEDEQSFLTTNGQDTLDKSFHDKANLLLVNVPNDELLEVNGFQTSAISTCSVGPEVVAEDSNAVLDNTNNHNDPCPQSCADLDPASSISVSNSFLAEQSIMEMECLLNSEDIEIPCNDDVCFSKPYVNYARQKTSKRADYPYYSNRKVNKEDIISMKGDPMQFGSFYQMLPVRSENHQLLNRGVKGESARISPCAVSCQIGNSHVNSSHFRPSPTSTSARVFEADSLHVCSTVNVPSLTGMSSNREGIFVPEAEPLGLIEEESSSENDEVPSFSDIEAIILEMDLCPEDSSSLANSEELMCRRANLHARERHETSKFYEAFLLYNEEMKKSIVRLEQSARSSMQRAIASRGALAVLYGRHLKHYIRDTEVILGRATDDFDVDIDLGREGPANKISRRQARINLVRDGSFILKNLGKGPMYVNGLELVTGQKMSLGLSSLIEIRGMAFVFEMDHKAVRRHLGSVAKPQRQGISKFEWSDVQ